jgi:dolichol-phosphate mannosyltransferase
MQQPKLSIIVPVFNEIASVEEAVRRIAALKVDKEIIVFDDRSTDGSREVLERLQPELQLKLILHEKNKGKGSGVLNALKYARGEFLIVEDSDLELNSNDILTMLHRIEADPAIDMVNGNRNVLGKHTSNLISILANIATRILLKLLYGRAINDVLCTYKLCRTSKLRTLNLKASRFTLETEWVIKALKKRWNIVEMDVDYFPRQAKAGKKINFLDGLEIIWSIIKLRFSN